MLNDVLFKLVPVSFVIPDFFTVLTDGQQSVSAFDIERVKGAGRALNY
jgi:hypothetical protein